MQKVIYKTPQELIPYSNNSRTHSDFQINQIINSIKQFGFTNPILTDGKNLIIAGHGRLMAAQKIGMDKIPVIELSHLSEAQKRAYVIADNKIALNSGWDESILEDELKELNDLDFDLEIIGFKNLDICFEDAINKASEFFEKGKTDSEISNKKESDLPILCACCGQEIKHG